MTDPDLIAALERLQDDLPHIVKAADVDQECALLTRAISELRRGEATLERLRDLLGWLSGEEGGLDPEIVKAMNRARAHLSAAEQPAHSGSTHPLPGGERCARCRCQLTLLHDEPHCDLAIERGHGPWWPPPGVELVDVRPEWHGSPPSTCPTCGSDDPAFVRFGASLRASDDDPGTVPVCPDDFHSASSKGGE